MVKYPEPYDSVPYCVSTSPLAAKMRITAGNHSLENMTNVTGSINMENLQSGWWPDLLG